MTRNLHFIFLINADSNKSKVILENFDKHWPFEPKEIACVVDKSGGKAFDVAHELGYSIELCQGSDDQIRAIEQAKRSIGGCDYLISTGWVYKVPNDGLDIPSKEALNVHSSYLPDYKGLSVHRAQWANAEQYGGVSVHQMTEEFDAGNIISQQQYRIGLFDTPIDMMYDIGELSATLTREAILKSELGYTGRSQVDQGVYYTKLSWKVVLLYGILNHLLRLLGTEKRIVAPGQL